MTREEELLRRITLDPNVCHGKPTIRGTRMMAASILELMAGGNSMEEILPEFPGLEIEDIYACLAFAARMMETRNVVAPLI